MTVNNELWRAIASGLVELVLAKLAALDIDARRVLLEGQALAGWLRVEATASLGFVPDSETIQQCLAYIADARYAPALASLFNRPVNARYEEGAIQADAPGSGETLYVYRWDYTRFIEVGPLAENSSPAAGVYVLTIREETGRQGPPSPFITVPA